MQCAAIKIEKKEGEKVEYNKMKVKQLKTLLGKLVLGWGFVNLYMT
jgi:hypothetical protein